MPKEIQGFRFQKMETNWTTVYENNKAKVEKKSIVFDATDVDM